MYSDSILFDIQKQIVNQSKPNYYYALDTGVGKTLISIHHYLNYYNGEPLLIITPPAKVKTKDWDREINFVESTYGIKIEFKVMSWGVLAKRWKEYKGYFVIFDEAHYGKSSTSQRGKAMQHLAKTATNFCMLSATPAANGIGDMINYFIIFGFTKNKTQFNKKFGIWQQKLFGTKTVNSVVDYNQKESLLGWYESFAISVKKEDVQELPPITFKPIEFKLSTEYKTIMKDRVLGDIAFDNPSSLMHGLRKYANLKDKLAYLKMVFESTTNNIIVFYQYVSELEAIKKITGDKTVYEVNGSNQSFPLKDEWGEVTNSVTLVQYASGSAGIELQYANIVVYYTPTFSYQDYAQSLGRAFRTGQKKKVTVLQFKTLKTVEEDVWQALSNKEDFDREIYLKTKMGG